MLDIYTEKVLILPNIEGIFSQSHDYSGETFSPRDLGEMSPREWLFIEFV